MKTFIAGRGNLACTIFVPYDCDNNCPFCTSKAMYGELKDSFNLNEIISKIKKINHNTDIQEFVLTGGEPLANLDMLKKLIDAMQKTVYINTTLPAYKHIDEAIAYINSEPKIGGVNISRHLNYRFDGPTSTDDKLSLIEKNIRINTILPSKLDYDKLMSFIERYSTPNRLINLRADYRKIDTTTLKDRNEIVDFLSDKFAYLGTKTCLVCNSEFFQMENGNQVCYHRGLQYSSYELPSKTYINDVLITPDGKIYKDWDFSIEDDEFTKWILSSSQFIAEITSGIGFLGYFKGLNERGDVVTTLKIEDAQKCLNSEIEDVNIILNEASESIDNVFWKWTKLQ